MTTTYSDHSIRALLGLSHHDTCSFPSPRTKSTRRRTLYPTRALDKMEAMFEENPYPDIEAREKLSLEFGVPESKIQVWFQNRRTRRGRTKPRRRPSTHGDQERQRPTSSDTSDRLPAHRPLAAYPYPHMMMPGAMLLPLLEWTSVTCSVPRPTVRPHSRLSDLLVGELRSYEANSSSSTTEESEGDISG